MRGAVALAVALAFVGCRPGAYAGRAEATATVRHTIALGERTLVLDGFDGAVRVVGVADVDSARVRLVRRAGGLTPASARERLAGVGVDRAGDDDLVQIVWRARWEEGAAVDVEAHVPASAHVVVRLDRGRAHVEGVRRADVAVAADSL